MRLGSLILHKRRTVLHGKFKSSGHFSGKLKVLKVAQGHQKMKHETPEIGMCLTRVQRSGWLEYLKHIMVTGCLGLDANDLLVNFLCYLQTKNQGLPSIGKSFQRRLTPLAPFRSSSPEQFPWVFSFLPYLWLQNTFHKFG
jgi:hypothetical protein